MDQETFTAAAAQASVVLLDAHASTEQAGGAGVNAPIPTTSRS